MVGGRLKRTAITLWPATVVGLLPGSESGACLPYFIVNMRRYVQMGTYYIFLFWVFSFLYNVTLVELTSGHSV